ncbi:MAG: ATP phosphoribosyltransferase, partial [Clostridia bacterium]|nr:ATP phosphoribosyltransferase [Clostridia bacterium]
IFDYFEEGIRYIICRGADIPTYVEYGGADLGIVGKDTIVEAQADVFELADLKFGHCKFVVALPRDLWEKHRDSEGNVDLSRFNHYRVATKFPRVAEEFFARRGMQVEVVKLYGNIELAPRVGLAELIVDIVSTGETLRENDLVPVVDIFEATARLIANRVSYRVKRSLVQEVAQRLKAAAGLRAEGGDHNAVSVGW